MKLLTVLIALLFPLLYHRTIYLNRFLQPLQCTTSLCTLLFFFCVSHPCDCWQYSGYIYPLLLPYTAELAKHCPFLKTPSRQAEHKFSPPKGQNSIGLKHFWRLLSRPAVQKKCFMSLNTGNDFARRYIYWWDGGLSLSVDAGMTTEDSFDERGCHCDVTVEDLSAPLKAVIRAVRWDPATLTLHLSDFSADAPASKY